MNCETDAAIAALKYPPEPKGVPPEPSFYGEARARGYPHVEAVMIAAHALAIDPTLLRGAP